MPIPIEQMQMVSLQLATQVVIHRKEDFPVSGILDANGGSKEQQIAKHIQNVFGAIMATLVAPESVPQMPPFVPPGQQ